MKTIAVITSFILGPVVWTPFLIYLFLTKTGVALVNRFPLFISYFTFMFFIPYIYIFINYLRGKISDIDISIRQQRYQYLFLFIISLSILTIIIRFLGSSLLFRLQFLILILLVLNFAITFFWKISFHMTTNIVGSLIINYLFNWNLPVLYLTIPIIFWSRLYLKRHSVPELLSALVINGGLTLLYLSA